MTKRTAKTIINMAAKKKVPANKKPVKGKTPTKKAVNNPKPTRSRLANLGSKAGSNGLEKNPQNINKKGRPRNRLQALEDKVKVSFDVQLSGPDKRRIIESMLELSLTELKEIANDTTCPAFMVNIAMAIRQDIKDGRIVTMTILAGRFFEGVGDIPGGDGGPAKPTEILKLEYDPEDIDVEIISSEAEMEDKYDDYEIVNDK